MTWRCCWLALCSFACADLGTLEPEAVRPPTDLALSVQLPLGLGHEASNDGELRSGPAAAVQMTAPQVTAVQMTAAPAAGHGADPPLGVAKGDSVPSLPPDEAAAQADSGHVVVASRRTVDVHREPDSASATIGYLRAGAVVGRRGEIREGRGCAAGFYEIEPEGYVCSTRVSTDPEHELARALARRPNRRAELPYWYGRSRFPTPPFYNRVPTLEEQQRTESDLGERTQRANAWAGYPLSSVPWFLSDGQSTFRFNGSRRSALAVSSGRPIADSAFAFSELFEVNGRAFGLSTDLSILPLDRLEPVEASTFSGVALTRGYELPLVFVRAAHAQLYAGDPQGGLRRVRAIELREAFSLSGREVKQGGKLYLETRTGEWLVDGPLVVRVERVSPEPHWAKPGATWIDVSLERQTLVAYRGTTPVYATLVSTGADAARAAQQEAESRATVQGEFRIHTKHVTATMDSDLPGDEYDLRDVPYVQYFNGGYALHAAFWHDGFGTPRSHGCVNLSPVDARWLFAWSEPRVPEEWHGAMSLLRGTLVSIRP